MHFELPSKDCPLCPRLVAFRHENRTRHRNFYNAPVPSFGALDAEMLVVGLAPGLKGANQTGRPFTGDYAGIILYSSLLKFGFAEGHYDQRADDGLKLINCRISNAVRCVPPENKPETTEIKTCNNFLKNELSAMPRLKAILTLGLISHKAVLMAMGRKQSAFAFIHGGQYETPYQGRTIKVFSSYHCSRYNINTGALTQAMFDEVVKQVKHVL